MGGIIMSSNEKNFYRKLQEIRYDMDKASLNDVNDILDHYNQGFVMIDGVNYNFYISPLEAACLNAKYKEYTGFDHPTFIKEQAKVLDEIIKSGDGISIDGKPSIYQRLKNNLTGKGLGISILTSEKDSYINKYEKIKFDMDKATLADVKDILDHYGQDSVLINGMQHHFSLNVLEAACLNARYKDLTGFDHPTFIKEQAKILKEHIKRGDGIRFGDNPSVYMQLKNNAIEIGNHNHVLYRINAIMQHLEMASLEDIASLLNYFDGSSVLIDGVAYHAFNEPVMAAKLNARYKDLTGFDHPMFVYKAPIVIDRLMKDKERLLEAGAYDFSYFDKLEQIRNEIGQNGRKR